MVETLNFLALAALGGAAAFAAGWWARERRIPPPTPKRLLRNIASMSAAEAAGRLGVSVSEIGVMVAQHRLRINGGGILSQDVLDAIVERQLGTTK